MVAAQFSLIFFIIPDLLIFKISIKNQAHRHKKRILRISHFWIRKNLEIKRFQGFSCFFRAFGEDKRDRTSEALNAICFRANFWPSRRWLLAIQAPFCRTFVMIFQKQVHFRSTKFYLLLTRPVKPQNHKIVQVFTCSFDLLCDRDKRLPVSQ